MLVWGRRVLAQESARVQIYSTTLLALNEALSKNLNGCSAHCLLAPAFYSLTPEKAVTKARSRLLRNREITAPTLRVIFPDGQEQTLSRASALSASVSLKLDLVLVNSSVDPPVAKIVSYGSQQHKQQVADREAARKLRIKKKLEEPKEIQFSHRIADHDLEIKLRKARELLTAGYKVMLLVKYRSEEQPAAQTALDYITSRLQKDHGVEIVSRLAPRRALAAIVRSVAPGDSDGDL